MTSRLIRAMCTIAVVALLGADASAQLAVQVLSVDTTQFPTVRVRVTTRFGGLLKKDLDSSKYTFREDGFVQRPVTKLCPVGTTPFSVGMVIANGSNMSVGDVAVATGVARRIVTELDGFNDEAAVISYNTSPVIVQPMTQYKSILETAIGTVNANAAGGNKFWDGVYAGLLETFNAINMRALLVLSDGRDDGSSRGLNDIVSLANTSGVKIFALGINSGAGATNLQAMTTATGGQYFTNPDLCVEALVNTMRGTPDWCEFAYTSNYHCKDGVQRTLTVGVKSGADSASAVSRYAVGPDPSISANALMRIDTVRVTAGNTVIAPLRLLAPVTGMRLGPGTLTLTYDRSALSLVAVKTDSTITPGLSASVAENGTGATITLANSAPLTGTGVVLRLEFRGAEVPTQLTIPVTPGAFTMTAGCLTAQVAPGAVTVSPRAYALTGTSAPALYDWSATACDYLPTPTVLSVEVTNSGDLPVSGLKAELPRHSAFRPAGGYGYISDVFPSSLAPGQKGTARWIVRLTPRDSEASIQFEAAITANEPVTAAARIFLNVRAAGAASTVTAVADTIRLTGGTYSPDPALVTATIRSAGSQSSKSGTIALVLPAGLSLESGTPQQAVQELAPGTTQTITWRVSYPTTLTQRTTYDLIVHTTGTCPDRDTVRLSLTVPVDMSSRVTSRCMETAAAVAYDTVAAAWPEITVRSAFVNSGLAASDTIFAELQPDAPFELAAGETARKTVSVALASGDSAAVTWRVRVAASHLGCGPLAGSLRGSGRTGGEEIARCTVPVTIGARPNLLPEITGRTPQILDTVWLGRMQAFSVDAIDADGDALSYEWFLNGSPVGTGRMHSQNFGQLGPQTLRCVLTDRCGPSPVEAVWTFVVADPTTSVQGVPDLTALRILGSYPNPFNPGTVIEYAVPVTASAELDVLDASGRIVAVLATGMHRSGLHRVRFDGSSLPSGVYTARLRMAGLGVMHAMTLVK